MKNRSIFLIAVLTTIVLHGIFVLLVQGGDDYTPILKLVGITSVSLTPYSGILFVCEDLAWIIFYSLLILKLPKWFALWIGAAVAVGYSHEFVNWFEYFIYKLDHHYATSTIYLAIEYIYSFAIAAFLVYGVSKWFGAEKAATPKKHKR